jgi:hypothetical protein
MSYKSVTLLALLCLAGEARAEGINARLVRYYGKEKNYKAVKAEVLAWFGTTKNGCVAFLSTALRQIGVEVPEEGELDGERISLLTRPFSRYLEEDLGWARITDAASLAPGDVVFTLAPEYPEHTYVFVSWKSKRRFVAYVIDNQGFTHARDLFSYGESNFTPFAYALRAP